MGGRGKGVRPGSSYLVNVDISYNPDRSTRPWSIAAAYDVNSDWGRTVTGRPRTFATERAAREFAARSASGPVALKVYTREGQHYRELSESERAELASRKKAFREALAVQESSARR